MIEYLWPTPVAKFKMPDDQRDRFTNKLLLDYDLFNAPSDFGSINIFDNPSDEIQDFREKVVVPEFNNYLKQTLDKSLDDWSGYRFKAWIAGYNQDYSLAYHNHRGSQISAVFYLLCEDAQMGGKISFTDPRHNSNRGYDENFIPWFKDLSFIPQSGDAVIFPSFLYHFVSTYQGNIRLALPIDLFLYNNS